MHITLSGERAGGGGNGKEWLSGQDITLLGSESLSGQNLKCCGQTQTSISNDYKKENCPSKDEHHCGNPI